MIKRFLSARLAGIGLFTLCFFLARGPALADVTVTISGPGGQASQALPDEGGSFDLNLPLNKNAVNNITVTAEDDSGNSAAQELAITQVSLGAIVVSKITAERLSVAEVEQLVEEGIIDLDDPENYNVSTFDIILTIDKQPVPISIPIAISKNEPEENGFETYKVPRGGGSGGKPPKPPIQIVFFEQPVPSPSGPGTPAPPPIPGVIIIEGNIKSLKEFFNVRLLLMNTSGIFTLEDITASISFPDGGLSKILPKDGIISFGEILPGDGDEPGQKEKEFIIRGDEIGIRDVEVSFGGVVTGPGIPEDEPIPFNGSAVTEVEVKGPPTFDVEVTHPDGVNSGIAYELKVDITNTGDVTAMYASLELDIGADAQLQKCENDVIGEPECTYIDGPDIRPFGHIEPGQKVSETFIVMPFSSGPITSCMAAADQNINLQVLVGNLGCIVGHFPPTRGIPDGIPTVNVVPAPNAFGLSTISPVTAFFSKRMNHGTLTTGEGGSFNVFDETGEVVPGKLVYEVLNRDTDLEKTVVIWQVNDGITNQLAPDTEYSVVVSQDARDLDGNAIFGQWNSVFTTTTMGINDTTPPTVTLSVEPPVNPNFVLPGQIIKINAYASDMGSRVARVEMRIKDLDEEGAQFQLIDQKTVFEGDAPPYIFSIDSANLVGGHAYQAMAIAYDYMGNAQNATLSLIIADSAVPPTIMLPDDPESPVLQGISITLNPEVTGGVNRVRYYLDSATTPYKTVTVNPYQASLGTLTLGLGDHTILAVAEDGLGQTGEDTYTFTLAENINMPVVDFVGTTDGAQIITGESVMIRASVDDPVGVSTIQYFFDDPNGSPIYTGTAPILLDTAGIAIGDHTIHVLATNSLGISNDMADADSILEFSIVEPPPGVPPAAPAVTTTSYPEMGVVTVQGNTVPGARVDITNTFSGLTVSVTANPSGAFTASIEADEGDTLSLIAYDFSESPDPSEETAVIVPAAPILDFITVSPDTMNFTAANAYDDITVTGHYVGGDTADLTSQATFSSSDSSSASVSTSGRVVALSSGNVTITADVNGHEAQVAVTVDIVMLTHITTAPATVDLVSIGQTEQLTVTAHYSNGTSETLTSGVSFIAGNLNVATVLSSGVITAVGDGTTQISVSYPGVTPLAVHVSVDTGLDPAPTMAILSPTNGTNVERGDTVTVSVRAQDAVGGVNRIDLETTGETMHSDNRQIAPPSLDVTQSFTFVVSDSATIGGTITVEAWAEDTSGNPSPVPTITLNVVDETAPAVTITEPSQQTPYNYGDTVSVSVDATDAVGTTQIRFETTGALVESGTELIPPASQSAGANFTFVIPYGILDPDVRIHAYAIDAQGNEGVAIPVDIILTGADITPPETEATAIDDPGANETTTITYEVTSGLDDLDHVELFFRRNAIGTFNRYTDADGGNAEGHYLPQNGSEGTIIFDSTKMGGDGDYEFYTVGVDIAGNREPAPDDGADNVLADQVATFNAGTVWIVITTSTVIGDGDTTYDSQNVRIAGSGVVVTMVGNHSFHNVEILDDAVLTHPETTIDAEYGIDIAAWTFTIDSTSAINVDAKGYLGGSMDSNDCTGQTEGNTDGATWRSGGSYGGLGAAYQGTPNPVYGNLTAPQELGSGGGCYDSGRPGGDGGGKIKIQTINLISDGHISTNGGSGHSYQAGSGSGGAVYIITSSLSGNGAIEANGGAHEVGGGGGRIAIHFVDLSTMDTSLITALGGQGSNALGGNGTVFLKDVTETNGTLVVDGQGAASAYSTLPIPPGYVFDNIIIRNNARVVADDVLVVNDTLQVESGSILTHSLSSEAGLTIEAARVEVDETSAIDVSTKGYRGGYRDGKSVCEGSTLGDLAGASQRSGGSYGGFGGVYSGASNAPYGHPGKPVYLGSGGGCYDSGRPGGNGGGRVTITATEAVVIDGSILANGGSGHSYQAGSGSGGSIKIETSLLGGAGTIAANGGVHEVGGGGGRVAIVYDYIGDTGNDLNELRNISAFGGHGSNTWGSAGTVVLKRSDQVYGDLYIDDNVAITSSVYTPLTHIGFGSIVDLTTDTITTDGVVKMVPNGLSGLEINPNINQSETFVILSNTENTITVDTSGGPVLTDITAVDETYVGVYRFDNVYFRRGGFMVLGDQLAVSDTMRIDEYGRLTHFDATLDFESHLELTVGTLEITDTGSIHTDARGYLGGSRGGNDCTGQTEGNTDGATWRSGGSYGGLGAAYQGTPNPVYGSLTSPANLGSGGGCYDSGRPGGDGGGWVNILANTMVIDGIISANGSTGHSYRAGNGSGGTVHITTSTLSGTGLIQANSGAHEVGGGGGRIAVHYDTLTLDQANFQALGGQGANAVGGNGSLFFKATDQSYGDLVVDGLGLTTPTGTSPIPPGYVFDNIIIRNNARVVADDPLVVNDTLQVLSGSILTHSLSWEAGLTIEAARVEVDETSAIDASAKGYRGGYRDGNSVCEGSTLGDLAGASQRSGASYGGFGGVYLDSGASNAPYGHPGEPVYLGSGGGCYDSGRPGGNGGGRVTIVATEAVAIDGSILANGGSGDSYQAGSGSGGSIKIETSLLGGAGTIAANGGAHQVGGGGGRVAIVYDYIGDTGNDLNELRNISAFGGHGSNNWGSAGTVVLRKSDQVAGDLYIDDNVATTSSVYTPLTHIGFGSIVDLTTDTITTDGVVKIVPNGLAGLEINPNINQNETFVVVSNTENTITVDTSGNTLLTDIASIGDTYAGAYRFDNVFFRRGGFMVLGDRLAVSDTMLIDEYGRLTHFDATLEFESRLDLTVDTLEITDTGSIHTDARGYLGGSRGGNDCTGQTVGNIDGATWRSGGSYGGLGAAYQGTPNPVYGSLTSPANLGSGGGCYDSGRPGGDGGGWVNILANTMVIDGIISANGGTGHSYQAGSGSGGTVHITTSTLSGTGLIQANSGAHEVGGGGGRVAVYYDVLDLLMDQITANAGDASYSDGENGTVYMEQQ